MAFSFFGGVHPNDQKALARECPITEFPAPKVLVIPMSQHIGAPCKPLVAKGDRVTVGQKLGDGTGLCVPVHSPVSGTVTAIALKPHTGGSMVQSVVLENDFENTLCPDLHPHESMDGLSPQDLMDIIREAGIVGMGGAAFPTHVKLSSGIGKVDTIIINASECEPYITADERLLREQPQRVLQGIRVVMKVLGLNEAHLAMEDNKPEAAKVLRAELDPREGIRLDILKTRYPQGAEKQLIQAITGREVPPGGLPAAVGCAVFNVATCAAIADAVFQGMPLVRRVVTVSGRAVMEPKNLLVPLGVSFNELLEAAGIRENPYKVLSGGPMMGVAQFDLSVPVIKGVNAMTVLGSQDRFFVEHPHCIRCGKCTEVCPMHLMPLFLHQAERSNDLDALNRYHMMDCIECGCCAFTCPAGIPLVQSFRTAKQKLRNAAPPKPAPASTPREVSK